MTTDSIELRAMAESMVNDADMWLDDDEISDETREDANTEYSVGKALLRLLPPEDDAEPVDAKWLLSVGWNLFVHWPSLNLPNGELLEWRGAGLWIGETAICLLYSRGQARRLCESLGIPLREAPVPPVAGTHPKEG